MRILEFARPLCINLGHDARCLLSVLSYDVCHQLCISLTLGELGLQAGLQIHCRDLPVSAGLSLALGSLRRQGVIHAHNMWSVAGG